MVVVGAADDDPRRRGLSFAGPTGIYIFTVSPIVSDAFASLTSLNVFEHTLVCAGDDDVDGADTHDVYTGVRSRDDDILSTRHAHADGPASGFLWRDDT